MAQLLSVLLTAAPTLQMKDTWLGQMAVVKEKCGHILGVAYIGLMMELQYIGTTVPNSCKENEEMGIISVCLKSPTTQKPL